MRARFGSSTDVLDFDYTVQAEDSDTDGVSLCVAGRPGCGSIHLDGGSTRACDDGSAASLGHPALGAQSGDKVNGLELVTVPATACADEIRVPSDWALKPSGVSAGGKFRLLFDTSTTYGPEASADITDYNG